MTESVAPQHIPGSPFRFTTNEAPMTLTPEERAEINRKNSQELHWPEVRRRQTALPPELDQTWPSGAELLTLPNEDPTVVEARVNDWFDYYKTPKVPARPSRQPVRPGNTSLRPLRPLPNLPTLKTNPRVRLELAERAAQNLNELTTLIEVEPTQAVLKLKQSAAGCRWLNHGGTTSCRGSRLTESQPN